MIQVLVDLARITIFDQQSPENSKPAHPENLTKLIFQHPSCSDAPHRQFALEMLMVADLGILASAVPFLFPKPRCLPIRRAAVNSRARARECIVTCFRMISPSDTSLRIVWRELALEISLTSFGSSQILRLPHPTTDAASLFWVRRLTLHHRWSQSLGRQDVRCKRVHLAKFATSDGSPIQNENNCDTRGDSIMVKKLETDKPTSYNEIMTVAVVGDRSNDILAL